MPHDYRTGRGGLRPMVGRSAFIAPDSKPDYMVRTSVAVGPMSAEERAAWHLMGVPPTVAAGLRRAGVHPFDVEKWSDAGIRYDAYADMENLARGGVTPEAYASYPSELGTVVVLQLHREGVGGALASEWLACLVRLGVRGLIVSVGAFERTGLTAQSFSVSFSSLSEALKRAPSKVETVDLLAVGDLDVVVALLRHGTPVRQVRSRWAAVRKAAGATLGKALVLVGADLKQAADWRRTGLDDVRCARLASAGYGPDEALMPDVAALTDDDLDVLAALAGLGSKSMFALAAG